MAESERPGRGSATLRFLALFFLIGFSVVAWKIVASMTHKVPVVGEVAYLAS